MEGINIESQSLLINKLDTDGLCKKFLFGNSGENNTIWEEILESSAIEDMKKDKKYQDKLNENFMDA